LILAKILAKLATALATLTISKPSIFFEQAPVLDLLESSKKVLAREPSLYLVSYMNGSQTFSRHKILYRRRSYHLLGRKLAQLKRKINFLKNKMQYVICLIKP
jgi:hypothetical protein